MAGVTKRHTKRQYGRSFPHSQFDDPRGGRASSLERNVLRYRAAEAALYLFFADKVRTFMMDNVYPLAAKSLAATDWGPSEERRLHSLLREILSEAETKGRLSSADAQSLAKVTNHDFKQGKKLRPAFAYAVTNDIFSSSEAHEIFHLLQYRNEIAHRMEMCTADVTRHNWVSDYVSYLSPSYKADALDRLRFYKNSLDKRTRRIIIKLSMRGLIFEHAEKIYEEELKRLDRRIQKQIRREEERLKEIRTELDLSGTELVGDRHPRSPLNYYRNGYDGGPNTGHLTKRGVEVCYRLFDLGKSPIAVSYIMGMSLRAANARRKSWLDVGGQSRTKREI
jgi:hypothetical protein